MAAVTSTAVLISAAIGAVATAGSTATTLAMGRHASEDDRLSIAIYNKTKFSFKLVNESSSPVRGDFMDHLVGLTSVRESVLGYLDSEKDHTEAGIKADILGRTGTGDQPWMVATLARAGGFWGPASLACYEIEFEGSSTGYMLAFMVLIRPNWDYTAGYCFGDKSEIESVFKIKGQGRELYDYIELGNVPDGKSTEGLDIERHFTTGSTAVDHKLKFKVKRNRKKESDYIKLNFHPAQNVLFQISDKQENWFDTEQLAELDKKLKQEAQS